VAALDIGVDALLAERPTDGQSFSAIIAGSIFGQRAGGSEVRQRDALQCLLIAQLVADRQYRRNEEARAWYRTYDQTLKQVGWIVEADSMLMKYVAPRTHFTVETVVADLFRRRGAEADIGFLMSALRNVSRLGQDDGARLAFDTRVNIGGAGVFQVGTIAEQDGNLILRIGQLAFRSTHVTDVLSQDFPTGSQFYAGFSSMQLNDVVYSPVRAAIAAKLGERFDELVHVLPLTELNQDDDEDVIFI